MPIPEFFIGATYGHYAPDHRSCFRAYKVYFAWWLRTRAGAEDSKKAKAALPEAEAAFERLLVLSARKAREAGPTFAGDAIGDTPFLETLTEVYGMPLTGLSLLDPEQPNLEARCLRSLD
jgi:hypothetical protein